MVVSVAMMIGGMALGGSFQAFRAQSGKSAQALVGSIAQGCAREAGVTGASGRVYGFSLQYSTSTSLQPTTGRQEQDLFLIPWYADADPLTGALSAIHTYATPSELSRIASVPRDRVASTEPVMIRLLAASAVASYFTGAETLACMQDSAQGGASHALAADAYLHVCFEPISARPHAVFASGHEPVEGTAFSTLFSGSGAGVGNNPAGYGTGIQDLNALLRVPAYPIEFNVHDLEAGRKAARLVIYQSGILEVKGVRG